MPRGPRPGWRTRMEPVTDEYILASVRQAGGKHDASGHYATLRIRGLASREEANEWRKSLHRCALWMMRNGVAELSVSPLVKRDGKTWMVEFVAISKVHARAYHLATHGTDKSQWPYDPTRRGGAS